MSLKYISDSQLCTWCWSLTPVFVHVCAFAFECALTRNTVFKHIIIFFMCESPKQGCKKGQDDNNQFVTGSKPRLVNSWRI